MSSSASSSDSYDGDEATKIKKSTYACIRNKANFSKMKPVFMFDHISFNTELLNLVLPEASPKLEALLENIKKLDAADMSSSKTHYKHIIYCDNANAKYGVKMIASALMANGFENCFTPSLSIKQRNDNKASSDSFLMLTGAPLYDKKMNRKLVNSVLAKFNARPKNVNGSDVRFILLDSNYREGIDVFDVKYVHLFEPLLTRTDSMQVVGRGTRFCGQKGLEFHSQYGWPLYVFTYDIDIDNMRSHKTMSDLARNYANIDLHKLTLAAALEDVVINAAVDKKLTKNIHEFKIKPPSSHDGQEGGLARKFDKYKYPRVHFENKCDDQDASASSYVSFTPTQDFVRHYFTPESKQKGILHWASVGSGKTCTAIATATSTFEKQGYTILWVTRHSLKGDIWKNMFKQICHTGFIESKREFPKTLKSPMSYMSENWIEPISYKQFSNMLLQKNKYYEKIVERNGAEDPLRKTLLIIDEAHKLYSNTVVAAEKPNMDIFEKMVNNSYKVSKQDSVKILLMTATPYTSDPMELIKLLNLCREEKKKIASDYDDFATTYLKEDATFTTSGAAKLTKQLDGYVTYINRSKDARYFAYPIMKQIIVKLADPPTQKHRYLGNLKDKIKEEMKLLKELKANKRDSKSSFAGKKKVCNQSYKDNLLVIKGARDRDNEKCITGPKGVDCRKKVKAWYNEELAKIENVKAKCIANAKDQPEDESSNAIHEKEKLISQMKTESEELKHKIELMMGQIANIRTELAALRVKQRALGVARANAKTAAAKTKINGEIKQVVQNMKLHRDNIVAIQVEILMNKVKRGTSGIPSYYMGLDKLDTICNLDGTTKKDAKAKAQAKAEEKARAKEQEDRAREQAKEWAREQAREHARKWKEENDRQQRGPPPGTPPKRSSPKNKKEQSPTNLIGMAAIAALKKYYVESYNAQVDSGKPVTKKFLLLNFHPDKFPQSLKTMIDSDKSKISSIFAARVFTEVLASARDSTVEKWKLDAILRNTKWDGGKNK